MPWIRDSEHQDESDHSQSLGSGPTSSATNSSLDRSSNTSPFPDHHPSAPAPGESKSMLPPELVVATAVFLVNPANHIPLGAFVLDSSVCQGSREGELDVKSLRQLNLPQCLQYLTERHWTRAFIHKGHRNTIVRVFVLPDDVARGNVERNDAILRKHLKQLTTQLDCTSDAWEGSKHWNAPIETYASVSTDEESLFYLFNMIPSPNANALDVQCSYSESAINAILASDPIPGLLTQLHPYQKRTVATMIKREVNPALRLDPRLLSMKGPTGQLFYHNPQEGHFFQEKKLYEDVRGGILAESMGLGKTLICLATIYVTRGHWPSVPPQYSEHLYPVRSVTGSLMQMAAAAVGRKQIPWRDIFHELSHEGNDYQNCVRILEETTPFYIVPPPPTRRSRRPLTIVEGKKIYLSSATLVIVPQNLLNQWKSEIAIHFKRDAFNVLYLDHTEQTSMPSAEKLLSYDIIFMSRHHFESEILNNPTPPIRDDRCECMTHMYCSYCIKPEHRSPLEEIHFSRIIMDEGHNFTSSSGRKNKTYWALARLHVDRKWVVSGTPASGLIGVEVGSAAYETLEGETTGSPVQKAAINADILEIRKKDSAFVQERKDLENFRGIVVGFLQLKPWANSQADDSASWEKYVMPSSNGKRKAGSLKTLLESLIVRHRIEDVERDIELPPLYNRIVHLQPSWHDKLNINLFIIQLLSNAVTSERQDEDYMFHPKNRLILNTLITNLRQSGFFWTGVTPEDLIMTNIHSREYLDKQKAPGFRCSDADLRLLEHATCTGETILASSSWTAFSRLHEMGIYVDDLPFECQGPWTLVKREESDPMLFGETQLIKAQKWVDMHLHLDQALPDGLATLGKSTMTKVWQEASSTKSSIKSENGMPQSPKKGSPSKNNSLSGGTGEPKLNEKLTMSQVRTTIAPRRRVKSLNSYLDAESTMRENLPPPKSILKPSNKPVMPLSTDSPLVSSTIIGTASAKLSYLIDKVTALQTEEKILIFYDGDQIAYYLAQAFDLIDVRYLIYTRTLDLAFKSAYITTFNTTPTFRVMLMNIHEAAHGLHIASASRVFFVNPVWQPNIEAQAIKRAHRIGQTRPVYVETLVLKDTLEDQMMQRRKGMTALEHQKAEKSLLDDEPMSTIIKSARLLPLSEEEIRDTNKQVAKFERPHKLFGRTSTGEGDLNDPYADLIFPIETPRSRKKGIKRKLDVIYDLKEKDYSSVNTIPSVLNTEGSQSTMRSTVTSDTAMQAPTPETVNYALPGLTVGSTKLAEADLQSPPYRHPSLSAPRASYVNLAHPAPNDLPRKKATATSSAYNPIPTPSASSSTSNPALTSTTTSTSNTHQDLQREKLTLPPTTTMVMGQTAPLPRPNEPRKKWGLHPLLTR